MRFHPSEQHDFNVGDIAVISPMGRLLNSKKITIYTRFHNGELSHSKSIDINGAFVIIEVSLDFVHIISQDGNGWLPRAVLIKA